MSENKDRRCPDCDAPMQPISLIDRSRINEFRSLDSVLTYTSPDAKPGFWSGSLPAEGVVSAVACSQCGRILLYAQKSG